MNFWIETERLLAAAGIVLAYLAMCGIILRRHKRKNAEVAGAGAQDQQHGSILVAYASQTGCAEELAEGTASQLRSYGQPVTLLPLDAVDTKRLQNCAALLVVASTYGEGTAPDNGSSFAWQIMSWREASLSGLRYAVLALGDSSYVHYCGFGRTLDEQLQRCGAQPLFPRIEVDEVDHEALQAWTQAVGQWSQGDQYQATYTDTGFQEWVLTGRTHLNPHSSGEALFLLKLAPPAGQELPAWEAGDIALVQPPEPDARAREYSIASVPQDGSLHLLVRVRRREDGQPGLASDWLTRALPLNEKVSLRVRRNSAFHLGDNAGRPLILIGNGSGFAGLRSHLKARARTGGGPNWLVFGERHPEHDGWCKEEIGTWQRDQVLTRADLVFSRAQAHKVYVQDKLRTCADTLIEWIDQGAAIYVCGSLQGMAGSVEEILRELLGPARVRELKSEGRYRRDVY